jgi:hypothetical protein
MVGTEDMADAPVVSYGREDPGPYTSLRPGEAKECGK